MLEIIVGTIVVVGTMTFFRLWALRKIDALEEEVKDLRGTYARRNYVDYHCDQLRDSIKDLEVYLNVEYVPPSTTSGKYVDKGVPNE